MNNIQRNIWLIFMPRIVLGLFIILNIMAMFCYPGGTYRNNLSLGYSFTHNFLSDLGRTMSFSDDTNFLSSQLFNMSLIFAGSVFAMFYIHVPKVFNEHNQKILALTGSLFGVLGGGSLLGVGLTPADLYLELHIIFANWLFRFMFLASLFYTVVIFRHSTLNNKYAGGYLVFTISILLYIIISELGPGPKVSYFALVLQVVSQKIILLIIINYIYTRISFCNSLKRYCFFPFYRFII